MSLIMPTGVCSMTQIVDVKRLIAVNKQYDVLIRGDKHVH